MIHLFGIRHHGPGSAHSLLNALQQLQPDIILLEGIGVWLGSWGTRTPCSVFSFC